MNTFNTSHPAPESDSPQSPDVVEVGDGSTDLLVVPGGRLRFVLDDVVLHLAGHVPVIGPGQSHRGWLDIRNSHIAGRPGQG